MKSLVPAVVLAVMLAGCETKITRISVVCRAGDQPTDTVHWFYTSKVDPTVIKRIPRAIDITLHYNGGDPRAVPPITTYFYRKDGAALRVVSSANATIPPAGTFIYHVDTGGYDQALTAAGREPAEEVAFVVAVDGSYFGGRVSPPSCGRWPDGHLDIDEAAELPDLKDKHPLNMAATDWLKVSSLPTVVLRTEGAEVSTYAFFAAPIALTGTGNETSAPTDLAKRAAEVGVTPATPTFAIIGTIAGTVAGTVTGTVTPTPTIGSAPGVVLLGAVPAENPIAPSAGKAGGNP